MAFDSRLTVSISAAKDENLSPAQRQFLATLQARIQARGLRILPDSASSDDLTKRFSKIRQSQWRSDIRFKPVAGTAVISNSKQEGGDAERIQSYAGGNGPVR